MNPKRPGFGLLNRLMNDGKLTMPPITPWSLSDRKELVVKGYMLGASGTCYPKRRKAIPAVASTVSRKGFPDSFGKPILEINVIK
jgi:hypothetical protein